MESNIRRIIFFGSLLGILMLTILFQLNSYHSDHLFSQDIDYANRSSIYYHSKCACKNSSIIVQDIDNDKYAIYSIKNHVKTFLFNLKKLDHEKSMFTCDMYTSLIRGKHQKVISYSLFGTKRFYYDKLKNVTKQVKRLYPGWFIRVYHDSSIDSNFICELECQTDEAGSMIDVLDFCDLTQLTIIKNETALKPVDYVLPRMWRFFPVGDSFVDIMLSRDSDSYILQREVDAVNEWLESGKLFHIMRDSPYHKDLILAGMWGVKASMDREFSRRFFYLAIDPNTTRLIDPLGKKVKEADQAFLRTYIYPLVINNSIVHDSYWCGKYGGRPFPTRRNGSCFVGSFGECNRTGIYINCPVECRPREHLDWITC